jgi:hypothetical protein
MWILDFAEKRVSRLDPATGQELATFPTPDAISGCKGLTWDGAHLCVMGWRVPRIYKMDRNGNLIATISLDHGGGGGLAWDGEHFWTPGGKALVSRPSSLVSRPSSAVGRWTTDDGGWTPWAAQHTNENCHDAKIFALKGIRQDGRDNPVNPVRREIFARQILDGHNISK